MCGAVVSFTKGYVAAIIITGLIYYLLDKAYKTFAIYDKFKLT